MRSHAMRRVVLVAGGGGFLARHALAPLSAAGFEVHAAGRSGAPAGAAATAVWHRVDLLDPVARAALIARLRPSHLLQAAWYVVHGKYWRAPENRAWVEASAGMAEEFVAAGGRRFVGVGTCAEYDWSRPGGSHAETDPTDRPRELYGAAKAAAAARTRAAAAAAGTQWAWARPFLLFGPGEAQGRYVPYLRAALRAGETVVAPAPGLLRDAMDVRDAGAALAALTAGDATGTFNLASGAGVDLRDVAMRLAEIAGRRELIDPRGRARAEDEPERLLAGVERLRAALGQIPARPLDQTLADAWNAGAA